MALQPFVFDDIKPVHTYLWTAGETEAHTRQTFLARFGFYPESVFAYGPYLIAGPCEPSREIERALIHPYELGSEPVLIDDGSGAG